MPLHVTLVHLAAIISHMFPHGPFFPLFPNLKYSITSLGKNQQKPKRGDASQLRNTFHLKTLRAQLVSRDDSITVLFPDEKAEQLQRADPCSGVGQ